ncbi:hypothetical protein ABLE68_19210 [Nocardioides sp. CN2-186]|uniref:hypothetical protein n=1 Tax=Nocardioides tweenelious TaxID=3156607 RepID=UPI0032B52911
MTTSGLTAVDPFDLPEWLGECDVTWSAEGGLRAGSSVPGGLVADDHDVLPCDLLAVDDAYPTPVATDDVRLRAHQAWRHGEVFLVDRDGRLTLAVPGTTFSADLVLDAVSRLARAVGASADHYSVRLRIGLTR